MICPQCGQQNAEGARFCAFCGATFYRPGPPVGAQAPTSGLAIASFVLALSGLLCGVTVIPGLILGIIALGQIGRSQGRLGGRGMAIAGVVVSAVLMVLSVLILAGFFLFAKMTTEKRVIRPGMGVIDPDTGRIRPPADRRGPGRRGGAPRGRRGAQLDGSARAFDEWLVSCELLPSGGPPRAVESA